MVRVKRGNTAAKRRKKYRNLSKSYVGSNSRCSTMIGEQVTQAAASSYISRRLQKRNFRRFWISRINSASRSRENIYSILVGCLRDMNIFLNRKMLALIAFSDLALFNFLERQSRKSTIYSFQKNNIISKSLVK